MGPEGPRGEQGLRGERGPREAKAKRVTPGGGRGGHPYRIHRQPGSEDGLCTGPGGEEAGGHGGVCR